MKLLRVTLHRFALLFVFMAGIFLLALVAGGERRAAAGEATPTPIVCDPLLSEGFESGTLGHFTSTVVTCVNGGCGWTPSTASPRTGTHAAFAPDVSNVSDQRLVLSNPIVPNSGSTLTFWHSYDFESFDVNYFDGGVLEASTNGGANWRDMGASIVSGGYAGTIAYTFENPLEGRQAWVGDSGGYIQTVVDLSPYAGQSLLFRFREGTDNSLADVGWRIDDILVTGGTCSGVTATPTVPTGTPAPVATCGVNANYDVITSTATIEPGTTDVGNHCDTCNTSITLPFTYRMYGHEFNSANVSSNGMLQFASDFPIGYGPCVPSTFFDYSHAIFPFMSDLRTDYSDEQGIFTSVSGTAPNRIFNIEWRASLYSVNEPVNFEIRLYEGQDRFDIVYGQMPATYPHYYFALGAQRDSIAFTQYQCDGPAPTSGLMLTFAQPACVNPTPTIPATPVEATNTPAPTETPVLAPTSTAVPTAVEATSTATPIEATNTPTPIATSEACTIQFSDVAPNDTFYAPIMCLMCMNLISGYSDGTFRPYNDVTRGQLAKLVSNAAGFNEAVALNRPTFEDIPSDNPFYMYVERVASRGIISGYPCGGLGEPCGPGNKPYFRPNANATRGQISKIVANAALMDDVPAGQLFEDVPPAHAFYPWIERLAMHNMMGGYQCGRPTEPCGPANKPYFRPYNKATRGQVSKIVANTFYPNCQP